MTHDPNCTGCPHCSALLRAIVANPTNPILHEAMGTPHLRAAAERELAKSCACTPKSDAATKDSVPMRNGVPDSWAKAKSTHAPVVTNGIPDGWSTAVAQRGTR
jgi:hypothetical protein